MAAQPARSSARSGGNQSGRVEVIQASDVKGYEVTDSKIARIAAEGERIFIKHAQHDVYNAYTPKPGAWKGGNTYDRRYSLVNTVTHKVDKRNGEIHITANTRARTPIVRSSSLYSSGGDGASGAFFRIIEAPAGHHGIWKRGFSRPFIQNAQREVDSPAFQSKIQRILTGK